MAKMFEDSSINLVKKHSQEIGLRYPIDEDMRVAILEYFESMDADIGGQKLNGIHIDEKLVSDVGKILEEFYFDGWEERDYQNLERRLKE